MIELKNIKKKYKKRVLFNKVNIKITKPGIYSFIGINGCGKTTLLNIIAKFIKPSSGKIINKCKKYSFISQKVNLLENLTIKEHFEMFKLDTNLLRKVNLISTINKYPKELSFGMRQRIAVLIGLYSDASLIILDEPTSHLDSYNTAILMKETKSISKEKIVLLVSHNEKIINKYSDVIYEIKNERINLIKNVEKNGKVLLYKNKKRNFKIYFKENLKNNKKVNFFYLVIFFILLFMINFTINLKENFHSSLNSGELMSLDYNKFYLKECDKEYNGKVTIKKCFNLREDKIFLLKESEHELSLNYDILLNDLYEVSNLNVINKYNVDLKQGRYPTYYNEVIASDNYALGEQIILETTKVITANKTDIYKNKLVLNVVGISNSLPFIKEDKIYFRHDLIESYLNEEMLINNNISLLKYFEKIEVNNYKYVLYFQNIDLELLNKNNVEYLSSSYEYYKSLEEAFNEIIKCLEYLNVFIGFITLFYTFKLARKKVKSKFDDILFFKASGICKRKIIKLINKENNLLILLSSFFCYISNILILKIIFKEITFNYFAFILLITGSIFQNKKILEREIERKIII